MDPQLALEIQRKMKILPSRDSVSSREYKMDNTTPREIIVSSL